MYKPPFLRRILPWLYALVFLTIAPILILYTAGYTYNLKKRIVERNGVLIVDGLPKAARISIDGVDTGKTTPYTFQTLSPGGHTVTVEKDGYSSWEKQLTVNPEQVTFANDVRLWAKREPTLVLKEPITSLLSSPEETWIATVATSGTIHEIGQWRPGRSTSYSHRPLQEASPYISKIIRWNLEGTSFVLNGIETSTPTYWRSTEEANGVDQLPKGIYGWTSSDTLVGTDDVAMTRLHVLSHRLSRQQLPPKTVFQNQDITLQTTGTPAILLLTKRSLQDKIYQLSHTDWRPIDQFENILLLKDKALPHWMALNLSEARAYAGDVWGDKPRWLPTGDGTEQTRTGLFLNGGEAWIWTPTQDPKLVWRQAEPLVDATWAAEGGHLILADKTHVFALELDERDGRETTVLATFDEIRSLTLFRKRLYIAAKDGIQEGVWEHIIE